MECFKAWIASRDALVSSPDNSTTTLTSTPDEVRKEMDRIDRLVAANRPRLEEEMLSLHPYIAENTAMLTEYERRSYATFIESKKARLV